eukprot:CAMPEP_0197047238 /NCGR_PEP_ID=MMETSP1384-20130603/22773_1 /TAXON_ID=29189 /ORGANISM="Ammonia sp." /LENGTH=153 /DNA_ID=CAMNT_0042479123 /DNA_START=18 /DNA_END=479 /DNA_ORIENTATION=+
MTMSDCIHLIKYLFDQYVDPEGLVPVNISSETRDKVTTMYRKYNLLPDAEQKHEQTLSVVVGDGESPTETPSPANVADSECTRSSTSGGERNESVSVLLIDIVSVMQECSGDLHMLLYQDSWVRFKSSSEFLEFVENTVSSPKPSAPSGFVGE